jgi:hypothetical protein
LTKLLEYFCPVFYCILMPLHNLTAFAAHAAMERELFFVRRFDALKEGWSIVAINIDTIEKAVYSLKGAPLILPVKPSL